MAARPLGKRAVFVTAVVLVGAVALGSWLVFRPKSSSATTATSTYTVSNGTVQETVSATGTTAPLHEADLDFGVSGQVNSVKVKAGDKVTRGQALATLNTTSLAAALTSAQAQVTATEEAVDNDSGESSATIASNNAALKSAEASLAQAREDYNSARLTSTITGVVVSVNVSIGDAVSGGSSGGTQNAAATTSSASSASSTSTAAVVVISPNRYTVTADVSADDIKSVKKDMQAQVTLTGSSKVIYATVKRVGLVAETGSSGAATFPVVVELTGKQKDVYAGTSATVSIVTKQLSNALTVPANALHTNGSTTYVTKVTGSGTTKETVTLGGTYGGQTVITEGLNAGDKIRLSIPSFARSGSGSGSERGGFGGDFGGGNFSGPPPSGSFGGAPQ